MNSLVTGALDTQVPVSDAFLLLKTGEGPQGSVDQPAGRPPGPAEGGVARSADF